MRGDALNSDGMTDAPPTDSSVGVDATPDAAATCVTPRALESIATRITGLDGREAYFHKDSTMGVPDATESLTCSCESGYAGGERVYRYAPPGPGRVEIDTYGSVIDDTNFDTGLYARTTCATGATELACDDDTDGDRARLPGRSQIYLSTDGTPFDIIVDSCGPEGDFGLVVRFEGAGASGTCANPIPITSSATLSVDLRLALDHGEPPGCSYCTDRWGNGNDQVFEFVAPSAGSYQITHSSADYDAIVHVRRSCDPMSELACDDDTLDPDAQVVVDLAEGDTILIFADTCRAWHRGTGRLEIRPLLP